MVAMVNITVPVAKIPPEEIDSNIPQKVFVTPLLQPVVSPIPLTANKIVKWAGSVGIIKEVFRSETSDNVIVQFIFPKNLFKGQMLGDIVLLDAEQQCQIEEATPEDLLQEIRFWKGMIVERIGEAYDDIFEMYAGKTE